MKAKKHHFIKEEKPVLSSYTDNLEPCDSYDLAVLFFEKDLKEWERKYVEPKYDGTDECLDKYQYFNDHKVLFDGWEYDACSGLAEKDVGAIALDGDLAVCAWIGSTKYEDPNGLSLEVLKLLIND